ncbi:hypothetical protein Athai_67460 [Actinocatenispora thailandica]|uniref:RDD domain-containing protein n=1 Tax=Actinocatenispora thailandica TaxID=227318 RepID=A0A7R7I0F7_9ACTN|nr:RDD family protein [Actinocatenispora thailandica]BCJ39243.1 hypothetical protein Athai_67460 [Actinocatenispora thailandica]
MTAPADRHGFAGLVTRLTGLVTDVGLLTIASLALSSLPPAAWRQLIGDEPRWLDVLCGVLAALLPWAYFTACWAMAGATIGGLLVGTRTCRADGAPLGPGRAAARAFVGLAAAPVWLVGLLGVLTDGHRRAWHDRLFGTVVRRTGAGLSPFDAGRTRPARRRAGPAGRLAR